MTDVIARGQRRHTLAVSLAMLVAMLSLAGVPESLPGAGPEQPVRLTVDYGDGVEVRFKALPWREKMTVVDVLNLASQHPFGLRYEARGSGTLTLVKQIGHQKNEGSGKSSRNWLFRVNDKQADVGAGAYQLKPGDVVLWEFTTFDYNP